MPKVEDLRAAVRPLCKFPLTLTKTFVILPLTKTFVIRETR